jgi:formylmethanofuran dehydrogenase subunit E
VEDYGKTAVTFADTRTGMAVRVTPRLDIRQKAWEYSPGEQRHYFAMLQAYHIIPAEELFDLHPVHLVVPIREIVSRPGIRVDCDLCGEEIINEREIHRDGLTLCRACAGPAYYTQNPRSCAAYSPNLSPKTQVVAGEDDPLMPPAETVESSSFL